MQLYQRSGCQARYLHEARNTTYLLTSVPAAGILPETPNENIGSWSFSSSACVRGGGEATARGFSLDLLGVKPQFFLHISVIHNQG